MSVLNYLLSFAFLSCLFCISRSVFFILILTLSSNKPSVCFKTYFLNLKVFWKQNNRPELFRPFKITSLGLFPHCWTLLILVNKYLLLVCSPQTFESTKFLNFFDNFVASSENVLCNFIPFYFLNTLSKFVN